MMILAEKETVFKFTGFSADFNSIFQVIPIITLYEGCQESSWTHMITASNVPDFDIHYYFSLK